MHSKYEDNIKTIKEHTDLLRLSATGDGLVCVHKSLASTVLCMVTVITHWQTAGTVVLSSSLCLVRNTIKAI